MSIGKINTGGTGPLRDKGRAGKAEAAQGGTPDSVRPTTEAGTRPSSADVADFSDAAERLAHAEDHDPMVEMIRRRIAEGFYQRPEVLDAIVDGLMKDLKRGT